MNTNKIFSIILSVCLLLECPFIFADESVKTKENKDSDKMAQDYNIRELILPSETSSLTKSVGSIYYNPAVKGKVLIPVHFWGAIQKSGLHFVPIDTNLVNGLSMAGGPSAEAVLDKIRVTRKGPKALEEQMFDLSKGGDAEAFDFVLKPGDTVFIRKDDFRYNRAYYTSLVGVLATLLSSVLLYRQVQNNP